MRYRANVLKFVGEVRVELDKCSWPWDPNQTGFKKYKELIESTVVVIISVVLLAGFVTTCDWIFCPFHWIPHRHHDPEIIMSEVTEITSETEASPAPEPKPQWYALHVLSGQEKKVKESLERRSKTEEMGDLVREVVIPTERVSEVKRGKKIEERAQAASGLRLHQHEAARRRGRSSSSGPGTSCARPTA